MLHRQCLPEKPLFIRQNNDEVPSTLEITRHAYVFRFPCVILASRPPEDLEGDYLAFVPTLPNFDCPGDGLGMISFPYNALEFIRCWDCTITTTPRQKFSRTFYPRLWMRTREFLGLKYDENREERERLASPWRAYRCDFGPLQASTPLKERGILGPCNGYRCGVVLLSTGEGVEILTGHRELGRSTGVP